MVRNYNLFRQFSSGYRFDLLTFGGDSLLQDRENALKRLGPCFEGLEIVPESTLRKVEIRPKISKLKNIFYPSWLSFDSPYFSREMQEAVDKKASSSKYDLIFFCGFLMFPYYSQRMSGRTPYVVDIVDSLSVFMKSRLTVKKSLGEKWFDYVNVFWAKRYEKVHFSTVRHSIFISPVDQAEAQKNAPGSKMWVVPNGVDTDFFRSKGAVPKNDSLLFTGVMDYTPNVEAMTYFIHEILPLVRKRIPNMSLTIAGRNPTTALRSLASRVPNITLTGFVEDIRPFFEEAAVCVVPIISGAGLKNKILEAWSMSKPVVATSFSCNGLDVVHGQNALIADTPQRFADAVVSLLLNPLQSKRLAEEGRRTIERSYSWESQAALLDKIIKEVAGSRINQ
jgi:glycosyltransferase involved in cell wall biosynthesis